MAVYWPDAKLELRIEDDVAGVWEERHGDWTILRVSPSALEDYASGALLAERVSCLLGENRDAQKASSMTPLFAPGL